MNERVRNALLGLGLAAAILLLLSLSDILRQAARSDESTGTLWWVVACYAAVGAVAALGVMLGRRDRLVPVVAGVLVVLWLAPGLPGVGLPFAVPLSVDGFDERVVVGAVSAGAFVYAAVRGGRA